ncbi:MAG: DUF2029 domain-containing protein, partial [Anaerolineales bacterium]|nr:DUF2029 domain-containing protein [Anaerolineales bacterium]
LGTDFRAFYTAGRIALQEGFGRVYDLTLEHRFQAEVAGRPVTDEELLTYNHPPLLLPVLWLLAHLDYPTAYIGYGLVQIAFVLAGFPVLFRMLRAKNWPWSQICILLVVVLLFQPLFISILKGQDTAFCLLAEILWLCGLLRDDDHMAGLGLSLTLIRPQIAIVLAIPFLFNRRKVFGWFCAGGAALGLLSLAMVGLTGVRDYLRILAVSAGGQGYGLSQSAMFNFTGLALRLFPHVDPGMIRWLAWGLFAAGIVGLSVLWKVSPAIRLRHLGLAVLTSLFVAPHLHYHDLALLLLPILGFAIILVEAGVLRHEKSMYLPVAFSLLLLLGDISPARFVSPYLVMAFLVVGLWFPVKLLFTSRKMA